MKTKHRPHGAREGRIRQMFKRDKVARAMHYRARRGTAIIGGKEVDIVLNDDQMLALYALITRLVAEFLVRKPELLRLTGAELDCMAKGILLQPPEGEV